VAPGKTDTLRSHEESPSGSSRTISADADLDITVSGTFSVAWVINGKWDRQKRYHHIRQPAEA
jgi:hypothetical protein